MTDATAANDFDVSAAIVAFKRAMAPRRDGLKRAFEDVRGHVARAAEKIQADVAAGRPVVPELAYADIKAGTVSDAARAAIRRTGCAVVRGVFPEAQARDWFEEVGRYIDDNDYERQGGREAQPRQVFFGAQGRQAADLQPLLVEAAGRRPPGCQARRDPLLPRPAVDQLRGRLRPRPAGDLCRPRAPPPARRHDAGPVAAHGRRHRRALDRSRLPGGLRTGLCRRLAGLRPLRRPPSPRHARDSLARRRQRLPHLSGLDGAHPPGAAATARCASSRSRKESPMSSCARFRTMSPRTISAAPRPDARSAFAPSGMPT